MRRRVLVLASLIYAACLLQSTVLENIEVMGIRPNLLLVVAISAALLREDMEAAFMGLACGLGMDILVGRTIGWYGMCLFLICFAIGTVNSKLYKENPLIPVFFVFFSSIAVEIMYYFINFFLKGYQDLIFVISTLVFPESVYNAVLSIPIYPVVLRIFKKLDKYDLIHTRL